MSVAVELNSEDGRWLSEPLDVNGSVLPGSVGGGWSHVQRQAAPMSYALMCSFALDPTLASPVEEMSTTPFPFRIPLARVI